ncbi:MULTISPECIES: hypothetical protein [unclassified Streptomyces]|uniref:hypothetical protein n=1 Tax=unclassified Streptomyces TaxID=2593676 RepID=UPI0033F2EA4A
MTTTSRLHERHQLIGRRARDPVSGRTGVLRAIVPDDDAPRPAAWPIPAGGGIEWTTSVRVIEPVTAPTPRRPARRGR